MTNGSLLPKNKISAGIAGLDTLIDGFSIGDNVVWEVEAGTAYNAFIRNFISGSFQESQKVIYVSFNRSPQSVLNDLKAIRSAEHFTLIDCFTSGKGKNDNTFLKFYDSPDPGVVRIEAPRDIDAFTATLNAIEDRLPPGARYVFDSLTGMQDLWGDENATHRFFTYMCPRLYDLGTVAYWILEKEAHSPRFKANLRHITQVVFDLSKRKNSLFLKALKLEGRHDREVFKPHQYEVHADSLTITSHRKETVTDIGTKLKEERVRTGMSQKELADKVSLTPSFLSQLENNQVSPSLSTYLQLCRALGIDPGLLLETRTGADDGTLARPETGNILPRALARGLCKGLRSGYGKKSFSTDRGAASGRRHEPAFLLSQGRGACVCSGGRNFRDDRGERRTYQRGRHDPSAGILSFTLEERRG